MSREEPASDHSGDQPCGAPRAEGTPLSRPSPGDGSLAFLASAQLCHRCSSDRPVMVIQSAGQFSSKKPERRRSIHGRACYQQTQDISLESMNWDRALVS